MGNQQFCYWKISKILLEMEEECKNQEQEPFRREFELEEHIDCLDTVNHWLNAIIINVDFSEFSRSLTSFMIDSR